MQTDLYDGSSLLLSLDRHALGGSVCTYVCMYVLSIFILDTHNTHTHNAQYAVTHDRKVTTPTHSSPTQLKVNEVVDLLIAKGMK
jgi:hypothetical protein